MSSRRVGVFLASGIPVPAQQCPAVDLAAEGFQRFFVYFDVHHHYLKNIEKLATGNPEWKKRGKTLASQGYAGKRVYRYSYVNKPINLIQENNNPHDHNAVMIQIAGEKVGYISAEEALHVRDILNHHTVRFISAFIGGGDYKEIFSDGAFEKHEGEPFVRVKIGYK